MAGDFCVRLIPGLPPLYLFMVLTKYCQSQGILSPSVIIGVVANLFNVAFNYLLIYVYGYGLKGAPVATSVLRWFQVSSCHATTDATAAAAAAAAAAITAITADPTAVNVTYFHRMRGSSCYSHCI